MNFFSSICTPTTTTLIADSSVSSYYDREAEQYDVGYSTSLCLAENEIVLNLIKPKLGKTILDVGCGTGFLLDYLPVQKYLGIDISPKMIDCAKKKYPNHSFVVGDMESIITQIESESFESIVVLFGPFSYAKNPESLLDEFYRVLRSGGTVILMPYTKRVEDNFFLGEYNTSSEKEISKTFYSQTRLENLIKNSKFKNGEVVGINYFGNFAEEMDTMYQNQHSVEFYVNYLKKEHSFGQMFPIEYARHCVVILKK